jgi:hypothetical protein
MNGRAATRHRAAQQHSSKDKAARRQGMGDARPETPGEQK